MKLQCFYEVVFIPLVLFSFCYRAACILLLWKYYLLFLSLQQTSKIFYTGPLIFMLGCSNAVCSYKYTEKVYCFYICVSYQS